MVSRTLPIAINGRLPPYINVCSLVSSQDIRKLTSKYALKYTPNHSWQNTSRLMDHSLPSMLSRWFPVYSKYTLMYTSRSVSSILPNAGHCTLPAYFALWFQLSSNKERHFQYHFTISSHLCFCMFNRETCGVAGTGTCKAGGVWWTEFIGWCVVSGMGCVACGGLQTAYVGWNHNVSCYDSLNLKLHVATMTISHDVSMRWSQQLQPLILQEK